MLNKSISPAHAEIEKHMGQKSLQRLMKLNDLLISRYTCTAELKFPFGNDYGWGYKYACAGKLLCYFFFEQDAFTVTITIGKSELPRLYRELDSFSEKAKAHWENRYVCGDGGWIHYRVLSDPDIHDIEKFIKIKKNLKSQK